MIQSKMLVPQVEASRWGPLTTSVHEVLKFGGDVTRLKPSFGFTPSGVSPCAWAAAASLSAGSAPWFSPRLNKTRCGEWVPRAPPAVPDARPGVCSSVSAAGRHELLVLGEGCAEGSPVLSFLLCVCPCSSACARRKICKGKLNLHAPRLPKSYRLTAAATEDFLKYESLLVVATRAGPSLRARVSARARPSVSFCLCLTPGTLPARILASALDTELK